MIRTFRGVMPRIAASAYTDPSAQIIGDVVIGERTSIWPNVAIRGDVNHIRIGDETSIQDNTVVHVDRKTYPCLIGSRVTVGHSAVLHGCVVSDGVLIGIGAIVLNGARIGAGAIVAAGALVPEGMDVPPNMLVMGTPAKIKREVSPEEQQRFQENCDSYVRLTAIYKDERGSQAVPGTSEPANAEAAAAPPLLVPEPPRSALPASTEERGSQAALGSSGELNAEPPRSALPASTKDEPL